MAKQRRYPLSKSSTHYILRTLEGFKHEAIFNRDQTVLPHNIELMVNSFRDMAEQFQEYQGLSEKLNQVAARLEQEHITSTVELVTELISALRWHLILS